MYGKLPGNLKESFEAGLKPVEIKKKVKKERIFRGREIKKVVSDKAEKKLGRKIVK